MFSKNFKRKVAVLLTGVMVLGMTVTAGADTSTSKKGGSSLSGNGTFEGHVNKKVVDVTLPTVSSDTFNFLVDSEGLIEATIDSDVWSSYTINNTGDYVYFKTGETTMDSTSNTLTLSNNSSVSINVTLKVNMSEVGSLAILSSNEAVASAKDPSLWLGLKVDNNAADTVSASGITKTVSVNGTPNNYQVSVNKVGDKRQYTFVKKADATEWQSLTFALQGKANKVDSAKGTTAPKINVTWEYEAAEWEDGSSEDGSSDIEAYATIELRGSNNYLLVTPTSATTFTGLTAVSQVTSFEAKYNDGAYVNILDIAVVSGEKLGAKYNDLKTPLGFTSLADGDKITAKVVIDGKTYVAVYTK